MKSFKIITTLILLNFLSTYLFGQCNSLILQKRKYYHAASEKDKVIAIRLSTRLAVGLINDINRDGKKVAEYITYSINKGNKPNVAYYIGVLKKEKAKIELAKQLKETNYLDGLIYCYVDLEIKFYNDVQAIINKNIIDNIIPEIVKIKGWHIAKEDAQIDELNTTIKFIEGSYPIKVTKQ